VPTRTRTPTATLSATPTRTPTAIPTAQAAGTPGAVDNPPGCLTFSQRLGMVFGILRGFHAHHGSWRYQPRYDLDHDGDIDAGDLAQVLRAPACRERPRGHHGGDR
jgi:hypothetical protein